ncbi:DNA helicase MCM8 isoform X2 [Bicyclus anynana]|uniref:DNA helicase MCM8 n=1 Tax=Bicyclus anynana TaxID=110368 RepID=A0ABM3LDR9_BICAN|nr:DNA helicase MCM8 isoform X2 [Bicyclus anynana]
MRRGWRGRYRNNWNRSNKSNNGPCRSDGSRSFNTSTLSGSGASTSASSRAPANQAPITIPIHSDKNVCKLYFPTEGDPPNTDVKENIKTFKSYIEKNRSLFDLEKIDQNRSVSLDVQALFSDEEFKNKWSTFQTDLFEKPETTLRILEFSLHETLKCEYRIRVRILNHEPVIAIANLKVNYFGKLVTIKGTVIRIGSVGLICNSMAFECSSCQSVQAVMQPQGLFTAPNLCQSCKSGHKFEPLLSSPFTNTMDWQVAKIQEIQSQSLSGTIPRTVEIELQGDLVGTACPGDVLSVTGIVQVRGESKGGEDGRRAARLLQLYVEAVSIHSQRNLSNPTLSFTLKDYYAIQEIHASEDVFRLLVHSLCPSIFGHDAVKAGLILGLMGGTETDSGTRCNPHVLVVGDPGLGKSQLLQAAAHAAPRGVYVCGASASAGGLTVALGREAGGDFALEAGALVLADRGVCCVDELDKMTTHHSSLLEAMEQRRVSVAKGGVVCSLAARATVLAAANPAAGSYNRCDAIVQFVYMTVHHSSLLEAMEQRRVSVAKGGVVCSLAARATVLAAANPAAGSYNRCDAIVQFVYMTVHHSSLLEEAMEQRRVSVAKGGVVCSLAARATVLAAANPAAGSYNRSKTVAENLKLNSALLSRFDLVFILLDQPDEKIDAMLSEHVLALHSGSNNKRKAGTSSSKNNADIESSQTDDDISLSKRLRLKPGEVIDTLPLVLLRKYIAYARRYVHPKLSAEAASLLRNFYLELRQNHQGVCNDGAPITTRQLEACIRLTQARARVDLREEATARDANDVISLVKHSLVDTFSDEFGNIQLSRSINGSGVSSRCKVKKFLEVLGRRSHQLGKDVFTRQELKDIHKSAGIAGDPNDLIEAMHIHSYLLLKGPNTYQLVAM